MAVGGWVQMAVSSPREAEHEHKVPKKEPTGLAFGKQQHVMGQLWVSTRPHLDRF